MRIKKSNDFVYKRWGFLMILYYVGFACFLTSIVRFASTIFQNGVWQIESCSAICFIYVNINFATSFLLLFGSYGIGGFSVQLLLNMLLPCHLKLVYYS